MRFAVISTAALLLALVTVSQAIGCQDPTPFVGNWVIGVDNKECVALVKEKCGNLRQFPTGKWVRGRKVRDNCNSIPRWTAIATFLNPGNKYRGHAAIFESCASDGLWVYDQWNAQPVARRKIRFGNTSKPNYNGDNFYTIEL
ncbi:domesticated amidase effector 2-like [Ornithodoros turicata]|uniref:domesticated amidase effector 2-like n=1 Tax=Ornithodoros turicata TaxID=34597 RepID=UPI003139B8B6